MPGDEGGGGEELRFRYYILAFGAESQKSAAASWYLAWWCRCRVPRFSARSDEI